MMSPDLLEILRCPLDPQRKARLRPQDGHLVCEACGLRFPVKDGFPVLVVEEAQLPPDHTLESLTALHGQQNP